MKPASPFLELEGNPKVPVTFDGDVFELPLGANLAAALLAAGVQVFRHTPVSGAPRAPFCMMGACFDCLVEIDGVVRQACMLEVTQGLCVSRPGTGEATDATE
ncbi:2Fe-2S iron-sulfur cluster-binding protein [Primorskyibacter aestuariivivens]|uniref:2Fe-2S iron-sulfur cluster-binding protein n=1 Tax=Primorskyibacter aestuariivivens TaxID=1888912 RepID=UPI002300A0C5|nr:2Fe-2S iron-sulfur cluster-binding protein [Primorskyibacter aestuariivivens]MDA7430798.1 2Fe-2S iron-sulfur cluster-binding protein [Primorskyibacter aestuariivivens]